MTKAERPVATQALQVRDLRVWVGKGRHLVVRGVDLGLRKGTSLGIVGESGSGKTMTLRAISQLMPEGLPVRMSGSVELGGQEISGVSRRRLQQIRSRQLGYIFQEPLSALNPGFTVGWQMREVVRYGGGDLDREERRSLIARTLHAVGLPETDRILGSYPFELSGGMRQRVIIAMALLTEPDVLLADEPTTALDVIIGAEILKLLGDLRRTYSLSTVLVSHDLATVAQHCDDVAVMYLGNVVETGPARELFSNPRHPYTIGLLRASVDVFGEAPRHLAPIAGEPGAQDAAVGCAYAARCPFVIDRCHVEAPELRTVDAAGVHRAACHRSDDDLQTRSDVRRGSAHAADDSDAGAHASAAPAVTLDGVTVRYPVASRELRRAGRHSFAAASHVGLEIPAGSILGLVGESGSGKSTLGRAVAGLQPFQEGSITVAGHRLRAGTDDVPLAVRKDVQFIFQDPAASLNPRMRVGTILDRALRLRDDLTTRQQRRAAAADALASVGLSDRFADRYPRELSGGQRQRVAIARALCVNPKVLIADEPTSSLDVSIQAQILEVLRGVVRERDMTLVVITHDFAVIRAIATDAAVMHLGEIVEVARVDDLIHHAQHPYTRALVAAVPTRFTRDRPASDRLVAGPLNAQDPPKGCRLHPRCPWRTAECEVAPQVLRQVEGRAVRCMHAPLDPAARRRAAAFPDRQVAGDLDPVD